MLAGQPAASTQCMSARRVSILLPCFNARAFLEERMDSILVQTFSDWEAGIAACDALLINRDGGQLTIEDMADYLPEESINDVLALDVVRSYPVRHDLNYRPPPHDCLLHFSAKSVYFSLTQLLIRTTLARAVEPFDTTVGSIADLGWLVRLTNLAGTVH